MASRRRQLAVQQFWQRFSHARVTGRGRYRCHWPTLVASLTDLGPIDEYRVHLSPILFGWGKPSFAYDRPPLRLVGVECIGEEAVRLDVRAVS